MQNIYQKSHKSNNASGCATGREREPKLAEAEVGGRHTCCLIILTAVRLLVFLEICLSWRGNATLYIPSPLSVPLLLHRILARIFLRLCLFHCLGVLPSACLLLCVSPILEVFYGLVASRKKHLPNGVAFGA